MQKIVSLAVCAILICLLTPLFAADAKDQAKIKKALQELNEYIGIYKGAGPDWTEKVSWSWRFKGDDSWLRLDIENGKRVKGGDLRFLPDKDKYQLTLTTADDKQLVYEGPLKDEKLILEHIDPATKTAKEKIVMSVTNEGARFNYRLDRKVGTLYRKDFEVAGSKEGEAFVGGGKKNLCILTGGLGTIAVMYKGKTYYVCCSGCRDAFNENPEKIIKEYEEGQKKK